MGAEISEMQAASLELRQEMIEATLEEFAEKHFKFTMDDIAKKLGKSKKTLYTAFSNKEQLVTETIDYFFAEIKKCERKIIEDDSLDTVTKLKKVLVAMPDNRYNMDFRDFSFIKEKYPKIYKRVTEHMSKEWEPTLALYRKAVNEGRLKDVSDTVFKLIINGAMQELLSNNELSAHGIAYEDALETLINVVFTGLEK